MKYFFTLFLLGALHSVYAQPVVYNDAQTLITGTWNGAGTGGTASLTEVTGQTPFEGSKHYKFDYNFLEYWAGLGLNMDNWGSGAARNFSGYSHLHIAYRGLSAGQTLTITLRDNTIYGNTIEIGTTAAAYQEVEISTLALTAGTGLNLAAVREIDLSISSNSTAGSGTVFFDAIELTNPGGSGGPSAASAATMARAASMGLGVNTSNWLEAYWLMPFNAFPEFNRYNRTKIRDLHDAGFNSFRLPVTFENLASPNPPYDLDLSNAAFDLIDSMILWSTIYNFKLIIVNHHPLPGHGLTNSNYNTELLRLQAIWEQVINLYDYLDPNQYFFEIYNEPTNEISNANWTTVAESLISTVRAAESQTHSLVVGANQWNSGSTLIAFTPLSDPDIIYTFHNYDPYFFTHQGMSWTSPAYFPPLTFPQTGEITAINQLFAGIKTWADNYGVPATLGEFGVSTAADATSRCNWIQTLTLAANTNSFSNFYWDAISPSDAFGFFTGGIINEANCIPCFKDALGLFLSLSITLETMEINDCDAGKLQLQWKANSSTEGGITEIEISRNGVQWEVVKTIENRQGNQDYEANIEGEGELFIRLAFTDNDGKTTYSPLKKVKCQEPEITLSPNPAHQQTVIRLANQRDAFAAVQVFDMAGKMVLEQVFSATSATQIYTLQTGQLPAGTYLVQTTLQTGRNMGNLLVVGK